MENTVPEPRTIQPGEKVPAYLVLSVRELRELLRHAEEASVRTRPGGHGFASTTIVLGLEVDTDQRYRGADGAYNVQLDDQTRERFLSQQFRDDTLASPVRWSKPCASPGA